MLQTIIIQPPVVQFNTPYPAGAYLTSFFRQQYKERSLLGSVSWIDMNIELFYQLFSTNGLQLLFKESSAQALTMADRAEKAGQTNTAFQLRRYISEKDLWCLWIPRITALACGCSSDKTAVSGMEYAHEFVRSAYVPRGMRMERYLNDLGRNPTADDAHILASLALADLGDYITAVFDRHFTLIRYAESLAASTAQFSDVEHALNSPVLNTYYEPALCRMLKEIHGQILFCISIPFPGTFAAALFTARYIHRHFGKDALVAFGGGYVNTELRSVQEKRLFDYADMLSYDRGYGSFCTLFDAAVKTNTFAGDIAAMRASLNGQRLYKLKYLHAGTIIEPLGMDGDQNKNNSAGPEKEISALEDKITAETIPDFTAINFSRYPRLADDANPMHRIWSDGAWIKAYLAYGCYWHRCAFCDTTLEYVYGYRKVLVERLFNGLADQAKKIGIFGIHFVDEALPPVALEQFSLYNCGLRGTDSTFPGFTFWGNIRFEKTFTRDEADLLAYSGLTGVSAGIEIATGTGLSAVNKGIDMEHIVAACCAFKEAGILVHSYMIYGFWNQNIQDLIDSMETLRQLFAAGLLDSAFWHKFTLTRHSTIYHEWEQGLHPDLHPLPGTPNSFAENDVQFQGEESWDRFSDGLNDALESWTHGVALDHSAESWFPFRTPHTSVVPDYVQNCIALYEHTRDTTFASLPGRTTDGTERYVWLGGQPLADTRNNLIRWTYMGDLLSASLPAGAASSLSQKLYEIRPEAVQKNTLPGTTGCALIKLLGETLFTELRGKGLCRINQH